MEVLLLSLVVLFRYGATSDRVSATADAVMENELELNNTLKDWRSSEFEGLAGPAHMRG